MACSTLVAGLRLLCGPVGVEDLVQLPGTPWLLGSGMAEAQSPGRLHLINTRNRQWQVAWPTAKAAARPDTQRFADCTDAPDPATFGAHGIALRKSRAGTELLVVNHGREAIEFFAVDVRHATPALAWVGCVRMPADASINSVVALPDGGFIATQFYTPSQGGMAVLQTGAPSGGLLQWHPGQPVTALTDLRFSGANGIEADDNGRILFVAAWGSREIVRIDRRGATPQVQRVSVDFAPDNLRWTADHRSLLVAGQVFTPGGKGPVALQGWKVLRLDPRTLAATTLHSADGQAPLQGVSVALQVGDQLWVGPFRGDRIASLPLPR